MSNILGNMPPVFGSGYRGVVPAPSAADVSAQNILRADGTWGAQATSGPLPSQTGNAAKLLTTDGTNASWASSLNTFQFGDVTLGTSGPSVKSTLSARAPRQGLVFDGTAGATVSVPAFGTKGWTQAFWVYQTQIRGGGQLTYLTGSNGAAAPNVAFLDTTNELIVYNGSSAFYSGYIVPTGKWLNIVVTNDGTTTKFYSNGIQVGSSADSTNYSGTLVAIGSNGSTNSWLYGALSGCFIYNRALSASEVVALYEAGAPAGADYNSASNTAVYSTDFSTSTGWSFGGGGSGISGGKLNLVDNDYAAAPSSTALKTGKRYRFTVTVDSITAGNVSYYNGSAYVSFATSAGTYTVDFTAPAAYSFLILKSFGGNAVCDTFAFYNTGLLLAPDAAQAGGGLTWYDTSGNAANITLPASGVSWNVPTSASYAGGWSFGSGGGNVGIGLTNPTGGQLHVQGNSDAASGPNRPRIAITNQAGTAQTWTIQSWQSSGDANLSIYRTAAAGGILLASTGGRVGVGVTSFSGSGALELATHTTSAGGIGFGTDTSLYRRAIGYLVLDRTGGGQAGLDIADAGVVGFRVENISGAAYLSTQTAASIFLRTNNTTALTLDSSQRTFTASAAKIGSLTGTVDSRLHVYESTAVSTSNGLTLEQASTGDSLISFLLTGVQRWSVGIDNSDSDSFKIGTGDLGAADKLTITTAGDATFAGTIKPQQAATASAPTYVKGAIYFDTTLNKLRVGGATGWETITSV